MLVVSAIMAAVAFVSASSTFGRLFLWQAARDRLDGKPLVGTSTVVDAALRQKSGFCNVALSFGLNQD